jgi:hypothetical protein
MPHCCGTDEIYSGRASFTAGFVFRLDLEDPSEVDVENGGRE